MTDNPVVQGSSPPVRGARAGHCCRRHCRGLIPARAGSTLRALLTAWCSGAHPRPCGEHFVSASKTGLMPGSSPPVRGAPSLFPPTSEPYGLIPARAGSTISTKEAAMVTRAHPRPCGEHTATVSRPCPVSGSSPPVRGARNRTEQRTAGAGLIPARAGSTCGWCLWRGRPEAHPRPCGEHTARLAMDRPAVGSSPPVRGALSFSSAAGPQPGLIPARAGSTQTPQSQNANLRAHPRPCGEHGSEELKESTFEGSSPPVRGAPANERFVVAPYGLIPARAGSTPATTAAR